MKLEDIYLIDQSAAERRARALQSGTAWEVRWAAPSKVVAGSYSECRWRGHYTDVERAALALLKAGYKPKVYGDIIAGNLNATR